MTTIVKPITRKTTPSVAGTRSSRQAPEPTLPSPSIRRRTVPVARTVIDLTSADQPAPATRAVLPTAPTPDVPATPSGTGPTGTAGPGLRPVLSVAEAAELLGVSEWLVLQQIRLGELPHKRCGRRIVLSRDRLLAWLNDE